MGIKYLIEDEIKASAKGLTVSELHDKLGKSKQIIRTIINRDLKGKSIKELGKKRDGSKIYVSINKTEDNNDYKEYLKKLHALMYNKMEPSVKLEDDDIKDLTKIEEMIK